MHPSHVPTPERAPYKKMTPWEEFKLLCSLPFILIGTLFSDEYIPNTSSNPTLRRP